MKKIILEPNTKTPPVVNKLGRIWENCRGGPYKYGDPIAVNKESLARIHGGLL